MFVQDMSLVVKHILLVLLHASLQSYIENFKYSGVPSKRGGVRIIGGGGWKWFNITVIGGLE